MSKNIQSSYKLNNFDSIFKIICENVKPKSLLEIGILDGYSLNSFVRYTSNETKIVAIDLFDEYKYKNSNYEFINNSFNKYKNVEISHGDFFNYYKKSGKFDIIHIDISNDADVYKFSIENYFPKVNELLLLEGGSKERDDVLWMKKYKKPKINKFLNEIKNDYSFQTIDLFPSLTIFYKDYEKKIELV